MIDVRRAGDRYPGGDPAAGIETWHAFSFGPHYDPANLGFGPLVACNEERLAPGAGFAEHPHRDVDIVTWVVEGELEHRDTAGHTATVRPGAIQWLSAGSGVRHVERNAGPGPLTFVQMWLRPAEFGTAPRYEVASAPLRLPAATLHLGRGPRVLPEAPYVYVHVVRGSVRLGSEALCPGDAARVTRAQAGLTLDVGPGSEYLLWELRTHPPGA